MFIVRLRFIGASHLHLETCSETATFRLRLVRGGKLVIEEVSSILQDEEHCTESEKTNTIRQSRNK